MARKKEWTLYKEVEGMKYPQEDLNIERHWRIMVRYALSKELGVTPRTIFRLINRWDIEWRLPDLEPLKKKTV
jgi:hypothetical protein